MDSFIILNYINNLFWNDIIFGNNFLELKERIKQIQQQISGLNSVSRNRSKGSGLVFYNPMWKLRYMKESLFFWLM